MDENESEVGNEVQGNTPDAEVTPGPNPAWNEVLNVLPEQFHSVVTPHFQKWDQSAQQRIEAANSALKEFEAYKPFVEHGITNDEIEQGLRVLYEINNNPQNVYEALAKAYNFGQTPPVANPNENGNEGTDGSNPLEGIDPALMEKLQQQEGMLQAVAQIVLNDAKAKEDAQADAKLDQELAQLKEKHGDYDEDYVLTKMMNGMSGEEAVNAYKQLLSSFNQSRPFAPTVLGNSGSGSSGLPSNAIDPTKLSEKETRSLVAQMLEAAAKQR
jgi:hypothetical protein